MKKLLIICLLCPTVFFGQEIENTTIKKDDVVLRFMRLSPQQLFDTAKYYSNSKQTDSLNYYSGSSSYDTALICYNLLINTIPDDADYEQQLVLMKTYVAVACIYTTVSDYHLAYDYFIKALHITEKYNLNEYSPTIYGNMGIIYNDLRQYEIANQYHLKALELCQDTVKTVVILNNLGNNELFRGNMESAYSYLDEAIKLSKNHKEVILHYMYNNLATYYNYKKNYDSAFHYFRLSLHYSIINDDKRAETVNLSDLGKLFFELNKPDSAQYYINLSNKIAIEYKFLNILSDNYLTLSNIEKSKGKFENALNLHITYTNLKDSIYNSEMFSQINLSQRQYEVSKTNQQIMKLVVDMQIKENTIHYQRIIQRIIFIAFLLMGVVLFIFAIQNKKLRQAYNKLIDKNVEIITMEEKVPENTEGNLTQNVELKIPNSEIESIENANIEVSSTEDQSSEFESIENAKVEDSSTEDESSEFESVENTDLEISNSENLMPDEETENSKPEIINLNTPKTIPPKRKPHELSEQLHKELLDKILTVMGNSATYCDPYFSIDILASIIHSNHKYISIVVKKEFNQNFRTFLCNYRIKEAQRIFMEYDPKKYSIEFIAQKVGFKSRSGFFLAFKEVTGVNPTYYLNSVQK